MDSASLAKKLQTFNSSGWEKSSWISTSARLEGNAILRKKTHVFAIKKAFSLFSKSVAYALPESKELALAYNNRSVLSHHIKRYDLSLVDIDESFKVTRNPMLKAKLLIRKIHCLKAMGRQVEQSIILEAEQLTSRIDALKELLQEALKVEADPDFYVLTPETIPKITQSREIPCANNMVEIKHSDNFGRYLTVNQSVTPGEILLVEDAYVKFPAIKDRYLYCSNCLNLALNAIPCSDCPTIIYCSNFCKDIAWKKYHRIECPFLRTLFEAGKLSLTVVLLHRSVITALEEAGQSQCGVDYVIEESKLVEETSDKRTKGFYNGQFLSDKFRCFYSLEDHKDNLELVNKKDGKQFGLVEEISLLAMKTLQLYVQFKLKIGDREYYEKFYQSKKWYALKDVVSKMLGISIINPYWYQEFDAFASYTDDVKSRERGIVYDSDSIHGAVIAIGCSLVNHSCVPNASRIFKDGKIIIYALRPLKKDEQIFVTYSPYGVETQKSQRQLHVKEIYFFDCNCLACQKDLHMKEDIISRIKDEFYEEAESRFEKVMMSSSKNLSVEFAKTAVSLLGSKICQIYQNNSFLVAILKSYPYEAILSEIYPGIYSSDLLPPNPCCT